MKFSRIYASSPDSMQDGFNIRTVDLTSSDSILSQEDTISNALYVNFGTDIPSAAFAQSYSTAVKAVQSLCQMQETVTIMPRRFSLLRSAKAVSDFIQAADCDNLYVLLAPGELLANSSEEDMFYALDDRIAGIYGSDIELSSMKDVPLGEGDVSWTTVLSLWHDHCKDCPICLPDNNRFEADCAFLKKLDEVAKRMLG